jgi:hypothetical protein
MIYTYQKVCEPSRLALEIASSQITKALDYITNDNNTVIRFKANLSDTEVSILDELVNNHINEPLPSEENKVIISNIDIDLDDRQLIRLAYAKPGWSYLSYPIEFETSKLNSIYSKDWQGNDKTDLTIKFYNDNNVEVTSVVDEDTITRTEVVFKPNYDYELIGGSLRQTDITDSDLRLWVIGGVIELGNIGVKEFVSGINLRYIGKDEEFKTDGRASKYMKKTIAGIPYQGNQLKFILRHPAGLKHKICFNLEFFRE